MYDIGYRVGYDVKTFRGKNSMDFFASKLNKYDILEIKAAERKIFEDGNDFKAVKTSQK
ncbi:MAG: hypothetical protein Q4A67_02190 [Aerococcus sp.]|nr:hypothetical protein [Aerococcus sp.]